MFEFNINDNVKVRLTDHGRKLHKKLHDEFWAQHPHVQQPYVPPKEDCNGWSSWQMWILMNTFGEHVGMALPLCFDSTIRIDVVAIADRPVYVDKGETDGR